MRVLYKERNATEWVEITDYVNLSGSISETFDNFNTTKLELIVSDKGTEIIDVLIGILPKSYSMITEAEDDSEITTDNTYIFSTQDTPQARLRGKTDKTSGLYKLELNGIELIKELEDTNLPNYTITQPKTEFFSPFTIEHTTKFTLGKKYSPPLNQTTPFEVNISGSATTETINSSNNNGEISYSMSGSRLIAEFSNINETPYSINVKLDFQQSALQGYGMNLFATQQIGAYAVNESPKWKTGSIMKLNYEIKYYNGNTLIETKTNTPINMEYAGGDGNKNADFSFQRIRALGSSNTNNTGLVIPQNKNATKAVVEFYYTMNKTYRNYVVPTGLGGGVPAPFFPQTEIDGFNNDSTVKVLFNNITLSARSTTIMVGLKEPKSTLADFVDKALLDYNFNRREKMAISPELRAKLTVPAPESEWSGYDMRELIERACKYVNVIPYTNFDTRTEYAGFNNIVPLYRTTDPFDIPANDNTEFTLTNDHPSVGQVVVFTKDESLDSAINIGTYPFAPDEAETYVVARVICEKLNTQSQLEIELYYRWENEDYPKTKIYAYREDYESTIVSFLGQKPNGAFELRAKHNYGGLENGYVISVIYSYNIDLMDQTINAPLFDKPFNQLTRNERKQQLDAWYLSDGIPFLATPTRPNLIDFVRQDTYDNVLGDTTEWNDTEGYEESREETEFYDTVISSSKNLVSSTDITHERILIGASSVEMAQMTDSNMGFIASNDIYYMVNGYLYAPSLNIKITSDGVDKNINTNMGKANWWDISNRLLDKDIYDALPNVNYSSADGRRSGELSQGNTIYYESGSNVIGGLGHQAPGVPKYKLFTSGLTKQTEYAVIEMLVCLAVENEMLENPNASTITATNPNVVFTNTAIKNMQLYIKFVALQHELTTKFISGNEERKGLGYQKRLNVSDRVMAYDETEKTLLNEVNSKGNKKIYLTKTYANMSDSLPSGARISRGKYTITSKRLSLRNGAVECEYTLDEGYIIQNTKVGLSVQYDKYNVPYEYVNREIQIDNHIVFNNEPTDEYKLDPQSANIGFIEKLFNGGFDGFVYAQLDSVFTQLETPVSVSSLMRLTKLEGNKTLIYTGKFIDNYSAGNQRWVGSYNNENDILITQPFKYGNYRGQVDEIKNVKIGYSRGNDYRLEAIDSVYDVWDYPLDQFPSGNPYSYSLNETLSVNLDTLYYTSDEVHLINKDGREALLLNYHSFLESDKPSEIQWYSFKRVSKIGRLPSDIELTDNLTMEKINTSLQVFNNAIVKDVVFLSHNSYKFSVEVSGLTPSDFEGYSVAFINDDNEMELCGVVKNADMTYVAPKLTINLYVSATRYGKK